MKIEQISVFLENKTGRLANIATALGDKGINIRAMSLGDTSNFGILRLIVDDTDKSRRILKDRGFTVRISEVLAVNLPDRPGELGTLLDIIDNNGLNVEYIYGLTDKSQDQAVLIMAFDDLDKACGVLAAASINCENKKQYNG